MCAWQGYTHSSLRRLLLSTAQRNTSTASLVPGRSLALLVTSSRFAAGSTAVPPTTSRRKGVASWRPMSNKMASDADYMAFLDQANKDPGDGQAQVQRQPGKATFKAVDEGSDVPKAIRDVCESEVYASEADEPFEAVSLRYEEGGGLPDEAGFAKLIGHWDPEKAEVDIMDPLDWDARGQYTKVIKAVREASRGNDVRVYRVVRDKTRAEYWVVSREGGRIVGAKALGVES